MLQRTSRKPHNVMGVSSLKIWYYYYRKLLSEDSEDTWKCWRVMTTRLARDDPSLEKSTRLMEMSVGERLRKIVHMWHEDSGAGEAAWKCRQVVTTRLVRHEPSLEKSTRLIEMSVGERKSCICEDSGGGGAAWKCWRVVTTRLVHDELSLYNVNPTNGNVSWWETWKKTCMCEDIVEAVRPPENVDGSWWAIKFVTSRHFGKSPGLMAICQLSLQLYKRPIYERCLLSEPRVKHAISNQLSHILFSCKFNRVCRSRRSRNQ